MRSKAPERADDRPGVARDTGGAVAVRPGEGLDWEALRSYLASELGLAGEFEVLQFPNGSANLTYLLRYRDQDLVFRRPPFGDLAPGAHDMRREFRVLSRLWRAFNRAPRALLFCDDRSIVGADFLVCEFRVGEVIWDSLPESMAGLAGAARSVGLAVIDALAELHNVDPASCGLADLGRPDGFVRRQVDGWRARWDRVATEDLDEAMRAAGAALAESVPESGRVSILHNDFKIDNCQFRVGDPRRVTSIFDWDMATLGDPLIDLGILLNYWPDPADTAEDRALAYPGLELMGLPTRAEIAARYAERSGVPVGDLSWYEAFASWKTAIVREQLHSRYVHGESSDPRMALLHDHNLMLARRALRLVTSGAALPPVPHDD